jgi:hypothetical protein
VQLGWFLHAFPSDIAANLMTEGSIKDLMSGMARWVTHPKLLFSIYLIILFYDL